MICAKAKVPFGPGDHPLGRTQVDGKRIIQDIYKYGYDKIIR